MAILRTHLGLLCLVAFGGKGLAAEGAGLPRPAIPWAPEQYVAYRALSPLVMDGRLEEPSWQAAPWSGSFVDIQGGDRPAPRLETRVKMLWDDEHFYIAAWMEEPHLWATLTARDSVIYHDNDFEVFIDPDGDTHEYYELELNALGTEWDLLLVKPYRDGGPAINAWDIQKLRTAVHMAGTLNDPTDIDRGWGLEIALPWSVLAECAHRPSPPEPGDRWRVNFSRVEWRTTIEDGKYVKEEDPATHKPLPEDNWVWSPQGLVAMHYPEMWGFVQFSARPAGKGEEQAIIHPAEHARAALYQLYYAQRDRMSEKGVPAQDVSELNLPAIELEAYVWPPRLAATEGQFQATLEGEGVPPVHIDQAGHSW